jgi:hypothetical protein
MPIVLINNCLYEINLPKFSKKHLVACILSQHAL